MADSVSATLHLERDAAVRAAAAANASLSRARSVLESRASHVAAASKACSSLRAGLASLRADVEQQRSDVSHACAAVVAGLRRPSANVPPIMEELATLAVAADRRTLEARRLAAAATARADAAELRLSLLLGDERVSSVPGVAHLNNDKALLLVVRGSAGEAGAAADARLRLFTALAKVGADVSARDDFGTSVLALAISCGATLVARHILLNTVAECETYDAHANTPLHLAANAVNPEFVKLLLQKGADARRKGLDGRTALGIAIERALEATEAVAVLRNAQYASGGGLE